MTRTEDRVGGDEGEALLELHGLTRRFGCLEVLSGVDVTLRAGQAAAVVGPNGSGKTTLMRCVVGADAPDAGEVRLDGRVVRESDPRFRAAVASLLDDVDFFGGPLGVRAPRAPGSRARCAQPGPGDRCGPSRAEA